MRPRGSIHDARPARYRNRPGATHRPRVPAERKGSLQVEMVAAAREQGLLVYPLAASWTLSCASWTMATRCW
ncbi:hypothetical protein UMZ34_22970 [Halopseudomonas pachastrellae]|nr:hypothetical protein UMZ34_22970 [Halopseudomonas pachastrellae]